MRTPVVVTLALAAAAAAAHADVTGTYVGTWGVTTLAQDGTHVTGTYAYQHGRLDGTLTGNTLRFTWIEDDSSGRGMFVIADDGELVGTWGAGDSDGNGGAWRLTPTALAGSVALAPPSTVVPAAPPSRGHAIGVRFPWDGASIPTGAAFGVGGVGIDLGAHVSDRWYVGASADWEAVLGSSPSDLGPGDWNRLRAGGELRYYFHTGAAEASIDDGPSFGIPRRDWVGLRYGVETFDGGTTHGRFMDVTLGTEADLGPLGMGMYLQAGASDEPVSAFGADPAPTPEAAGTIADPSTPTALCPYLAIGMSLLFG